MHGPCRLIEEQLDAVALCLSGVLQEVEFLAFGDSLLAILKGDRALYRPDELAGPLILTLRYHFS